MFLLNLATSKKWHCKPHKFYTMTIPLLCSAGPSVQYSFHRGHFTSTIQSQNLPFHIWLACDPYESGQSLLQNFSPCCHIFSSATDVVNHIRASCDASVIHGYLIHSPCFQTSEMTTTFWHVQATIISQLRLIQSFLIIIAMIHHDHNGCSMNTFSLNLKSNSWVLSSKDVFYPDLGDPIAGSCCLITTVHSFCTSTVNSLLLKQPPLVTPRTLGEFIWEPFICTKHAISLARDNADLGKQVTRLKTSTPILTPNNDRGIIIIILFIVLMPTTQY